ncbi:MAG TPA: hypothetical protein VMD79_10010 [Solirubrobacteraceae bacterium]|nr:hypothetical protein [Solirubrobacteraceae bacterium]
MRARRTIVAPDATSAPDAPESLPQATVRRRVRPRISLRARPLAARVRALAWRLAKRLAAAVWWGIPCVATGLGAAIPVINSTVKAVRAGWVPAGDDGIIATRGWDVLTSHTPLVGQYSEAGLVIKGQVMHSPGPMLYWLLALPARFGSVTSLAATMGAVNTLAIVGCVMLARRRGGLVLMFATGAGIAVMCQSLPTEAMHDIWNPAAGLFPFLLLIFLGWSLACGDHRLLPLTALDASYVTQTHLMYAAPTAVVLIVGLGALLVRALVGRHARRRLARWKRPRLPRWGRRSRLPRAPSVAREPCGPRPPRVWPWALAALAVVVACWTLPAIDQSENSPGNLTMIVRTAEHRGPTLGASVGWHAVVRSIGEHPWWLYVPASEWERKHDVLAKPSAAAVSSTRAILAALLLVVLLGACLRRWDAATAALIGLGLCAAIGLEAASNPSAQLLAETLGYTMWWGSELGLWVWLVLAWALWLTVAALVQLVARPLRQLVARALGRLAAASPRAWLASVQLAHVRRAAVAIASLASIVVVAALGDAVAATAKPDSHAYDYRPIHEIAAGIERVIPPGVNIDYGLGPLDLTTQPMEPAIRFLLVRHRDRPMAEGSFPRLGSYYELYDRPVQWRLLLTDATRPQRHMTLAARVRFTGPWGPVELSAWVQRVTHR